MSQFPTQVPNGTAPGVAAESTSEWMQQLQSLGWIDLTAIAVLLVFFVLGLFKGLIWQVSRIGILVAAYLVAGRWGQDVADMLSSMPADQIAADAMASTALAPGEATLYLAYVLLFLAVLIALSLAAMLIKKLADKAGLSFFDRMGGGILGVATGACVVRALVFGVNMFFPESKLAQAAESSHALRFSQQAIQLLGGSVNDELRSVLRLRPLNNGQAGGSQGSPLPGQIHPDLVNPGGTAPGVLPGIGPGPQPSQPVQPPRRSGAPGTGAGLPGEPRPYKPRPTTGNGGDRRGND